MNDLQIAIDLRGTDLEIIRGASFRIPAGKTVALVGESGSGKSILSQAILGILPNVARITGGSIWFTENPSDEPQDLAALADNSAERIALRGGKISIIFQEPMTSLSPLHTIGNQIQEALELHHAERDDAARKTTIDMLELVGFPNPEAAYSMYPMELSGGLRQRAMIAMALICRPALLIADEPTTALDVSMQAKILSLLKDMQQRLGMAVLLITHDLGVVANMADEVVVMYHGQIMEAGPVESIFRDPQHDYLKALLKAVPNLSMGYDEKLQSLRDIDHEIPPSMLGKVEQRKQHKNEVLLEVRDLHKTFVTKKSGWFSKSKTEVVAVDDVSFNVIQGECFGLVGESGCGKTTTLKMLVRALTPDSGTITWNDTDRKIDLLGLQGKELKAFRRRIQMVFQDPFSSLSPRATVLNTLKEPMEVHGINTDSSKSAYAAELMRLVGLDPAYLGRYPHSFSGGQRQRIGIARALALRPDLLVCDEPVSALDVSVQAQVLNLLKQLQEELGLTYIFISHNLAVIRYIADRIGVMFRGQLVEVATRRELFENPVHPYTRALLDVVPHADLDHPLDFDRLNRDMATEGRDWREPFSSVGNVKPMDMVAITDNHRVRAIRGTGPKHFQEANLRNTPMKRLLSISITALLFGFASAYAGPPEEPRVVDFEALGKTIGKQGGKLRMLMAKPKDIRMMVIYSGARLVSYDSTFRLVPDMLKAVDVDGNKSFTLHIRKGHLWSDGTPFSTEDFRYWWENVANNSTLSKGGVPRQMLVDGKPPVVEFIDANTIRYTWEKPNPLFLTALAGARPLYIYQPAHYMKQFHEKYADADKLASMIKAEKVQGWRNLHIRKGRQYRPENPDAPTLQPWMNTTPLPTERFVFKRNPNFHRVDSKGTQLPYIDEVIINMASRAIIAAKAGTGESDLQGRYLRFDNYAFLKKGAKTNNYEVRLWPSGKGSERVLLPNMNAADAGWRKAFQDVRVRRAISLAIDREEINEAIFFGLARVSANSVLPSSPLFQNKFAEAYATRDVEEANRLLDEAGYEKRDGDGFRMLPDGRKMEIIVETAGESSQETDILQLVTDHLSEVGIAMFVKPGQRDVLRNRVASGEVIMSTWEGINRGLATPEMNPEDLAPVSPVQGQWPAWGKYLESKGAAGEAPTLPEVQRLSELYKNWRIAASREEQEKIWTEMLTIFTDQVYTIGIVSGGLQPIVVNKKLQNVPKEAIWAFNPTAYFGNSMPDTYWFSE